MMKKAYVKRALILALSCSLWNVSLGSCASLSIDEAVDMAAQRNPEIKIAVKGEEKSLADLNAAKGANGLSVSATSALTITDGATKSFSKDNSNGISVTLPLYTGGENELAIENKNLELLSSQLNSARTRENIKLSVIKAYYDVLENQKEVEVDQESVNNYQSHLVNVQQLYSAGSKARVEVLRSEVELSDAKQTLIKAQNSYDIALSTLKNIIKLDRDEPLTLTDDFVYTTFDKAMADCLDYARTNRKDLKQAQLTVDESEKKVKIAKAGFLPSVDLTGGLDWDNQPLPNDKHYAYSAGVKATWDLFDNNVTQSNIKSAQATLEEAQLTLMKNQDDVDLAVRQAYLNMKEAEKRFISTHDAVRKAQEDYYIANEKYKAGDGLMLDIIDAQLALSTAQLNYISAQYDYARYKATVENVMGIEDGVKG
jgi:outer membrane protein